MTKWDYIKQMEFVDKESAIEKYEAIQRYLLADNDFWAESEIEQLFDEIFELIEKKSK